MACCKSMTFKVPGDDYIVEFYKMRGCEIREEGGETFVSVPSKCPQLHEMFGCKVYPERPVICRVMNGMLDPATRDKCLWGKESGQ